MAVEQETNQTLTCPTTVNNEIDKVDPNPDHHHPTIPRLSEKKRNPFQSIKAALYLLSKKSSSNTNSESDSKPVKSDDDAPSKGGFWRTLLGSMRPMHAQNNMQSPPPSYLEKRGASSPERDELFTPPPSPPPKSGANSKYASALNLQELDNEEAKNPSLKNLQGLDHQSNEGNGCNNDHPGDGDEMIDTKAEDFINQFYEQMRLQKSDSTNSYNAAN